MPKQPRGQPLALAGFGRGLRGELAAIRVFDDAIPIAKLAECGAADAAGGAIDDKLAAKQLLSYDARRCAPS